MLDILSSVIPIFIIMLMGKIIKSAWLRSEEFWRGLESLSYYLLFPVVLFNYIAQSELSSQHLLKMVLSLIFATTITGVGLVAFQRKYEIDGRVFTSIFQGGVRYNSYIFFALGSALYGTQGMEIVAVIAAYMIIFTNSISILAFTVYCPDGASDGQKLAGSQWEMFAKNFMMNPLIIASVAGFLFNYSNIVMLSSIGKTLQTLSESAHTIGLLCVGASLSFSASTIDKFAVGAACATKLVIMPAITFIILKAFGIKGVAHSVCMLYSALPTATNSYLLSKQLGGDADTMTTIITFSIAFSMITLAIFTYILA
ncbi:MAG: AEC family transporter [Rickettsiaceae bacterium]|nr:AEC family transporter [Rickettsiaceae bacterium]